MPRPIRSILVVALLVAATACAPSPGAGETLGSNFLAGLGRPDLTLRYGSPAPAIADLYLPVTPNGAAIIYVHGGAWVTGSRRDLPEAVKRAVTRGFIVVSIDYRLARPPATIDDGVADVVTSVRWLQANGAAWSVDPTRIVLWGHSSGAHLATLAALDATSSDPNSTEPSAEADVATVPPIEIAGLVNVSGPVNIAALRASSEINRLVIDTAVGPTADLPTTLSRLDPRTRLAASAPPIYVAAGDLDQLVPWTQHGLPMAVAWSAARGGSGVTYDLVRNGSDDTRGHRVEGGINISELDRFLARVTHT